MNRSLIIIISYNSGDYIGKCLNSIINQTHREWFLAVIDNNSSDNSIKEIKDFRNSTPGINPKNFKFVRLHKNYGYAGAINYFLFKWLKKRRHLKFSNIVFLNPDMYLKEDALEYLTAPFEEGEGIGVCGGLILDYSTNEIQHIGGLIKPNFITEHVGKGKNYDELKEEYKHKPGNILEITKDVTYVTGAMLATDFDLYKKSGGFDTGYRPAYYEELDYCLKLKEAGYRIVVNPLALARHAEAASSKRFSKKFYKFYHKNRIRCAIINSSIFSYLKLIAGEIKWLREAATRGQYSLLLYAYFINFVFCPFNMLVKLKNYLILKKL